jgi:hypothetical protein
MCDGCRALNIRLCMRTADTSGGPLGRETGSVVGIHFEVAGMYTGTLIRDLMATVELAEFRAEQRQLAEERELRAMFAMQIPAGETSRIIQEQTFQGAA